MYKKDPVIYIGYDEREHDAFEVLVHSIKKHASKPITILPLKQDKLRAAGLYSRLHYTDSDGQCWDSVDGRPFSTQFSFTRFLVSDRKSTRLNSSHSQQSRMASSA